MSIRIACLLALSSCLSLVACGESSPPPGEAPASQAVATPGSATAGELRIQLTGKTVGRNSSNAPDSVQCQVEAAVTNDSPEDLKSLHAEFELSAADGGALAMPRSSLTMPMAIKAGATESAWGPMVIDDVRCEDLHLRLAPTTAGACRTSSKAPCAVYSVSGSGLGGVE